VARFALFGWNYKIMQDGYNEKAYADYKEHISTLLWVIQELYKPDTDLTVTEQISYVLKEIAWITEYISDLDSKILALKYQIEEKK
jgi:hypothetical protein